MILVMSRLSLLIWMLVNLLIRDNLLYALGQVAVHKSHKMATHVGLSLRFCTRCGTHGANRSNNLKYSCKKPTRAGLEALRCIRQGFQPSRYQQEHLDRRNLKVWLGSRKFKARKPPPKMRNIMRFDGIDSIESENPCPHQGFSSNMMISFVSQTIG